MSLVLWVFLCSSLILVAVSGCGGSNTKGSPSAPVAASSTATVTIGAEAPPDAGAAGATEQEPLAIALSRLEQAPSGFVVPRDWFGGLYDVFDGIVMGRDACELSERLRIEPRGPLRTYDVFFAAPPLSGYDDNLQAVREALGLQPAGPATPGFFTNSRDMTALFDPRLVAIDLLAEDESITREISRYLASLPSLRTAMQNAHEALGLQPATVWYTVTMPDREVLWIDYATQPGERRVEDRGRAGAWQLKLIVDDPGTRVPARLEAARGWAVEDAHHSCVRGR